MSIYVPGIGTGTERATNVATVGQSVYMVKVVVGPWWRLLIPIDPDKLRRH